MNDKLRNYVDMLFSEVPRSRKALELKQEILSNLNERFEELVVQGKSETQAYGLAVAGMGDIDELLVGLVPDIDLKEKINAYRKRRALHIAIGVALYILGVVALLVFELLDFDDFGVIALLTFVAAATALIIYTNMSVPQEVAPYLTKSNLSGSNSNCNSSADDFAKKDPLWSSFFKLYWTLVPLVYLLVSFITQRWAITWLIFLAAVAIEQGIKLIVMLTKSN